MTRTPVALVALSLLALAAAPPAVSRSEEGPAHPTLAIGAEAPDFDLPGVDGKRYTLASFAEAKVLVVVFTANHCPTAQAYEERIEKLHADFAGAGRRSSSSSRRTTRWRCGSTSRATPTSATRSRT